jgi:hypothetical protein
MPLPDEAALAATPAPLSSVMRAVVNHRGIRIAAASWVVGYVVARLTLRTGNAWVHALGYHAVAPHLVADTPLVVRIFGIR